MGQVEPIPKSVVAAICRIQQSIGAVAKTQKNQHGGYMYSSADDIYAALSKKMGEAGLTLISLEDDCEIKRFEKDGKTVQWAHVVYSFVLATGEETWTDPRARRTLYIQVTGPQTFQAAQSYAEKSFLRSMFKLPTGDVDLDGLKEAETEEGQVALNGKGKRKSSYAAKKDGTPAVFNDIVKQIREAPAADVLSQIPDLYADEIGKLPTKWAELVNDEFELRMEGLRS